MAGTVTALALRYASVTGWFAPREIAAALGLEESGLLEALWREFSLQVTEGVIDRAYGWKLNPDSRRAALADIFSHEQLRQALRKAPKAWPNDPFGQALQTILRSPSPKRSVSRLATNRRMLEQSLSHYAAVLDAVQFAKAVPGLEPAGLERIQRVAELEIRTLQRRRDLQVVLPRKHFGYAAEVRRLSHFLRAGTKQSRPILLTGVGGVGKSALLARVLGSWQSRPHAPLIVILDFDRRQLNGGEPVEIMHEFLRQLVAGIGLRDPLPEGPTYELIKKLRDMRQTLPKLTGSGDQRTHESQLSYLTWAWLPLFGEPWAEPLRTECIAMIFDSFEAVDRQGGFVVEKILELEAALRAGGLRHLRTVVSGREPPLGKDALARFFGPERRRLRLEGVDNVAGASLLLEEDLRLAADGVPVLVSLEERERVSHVLRGYPLALIVFARYARRHPDDVDGLIASLETDSAFQAEFGHAFLYERILDRIDDPVASKLAHPGLALRQLSVDLIRFVLATPCLGQAPDDVLGEAEAGKMLEDLRDEYWLVEDHEPPFPLRHRPDLRRLMVSGLFAGPRDSDPAEVVERKTKLRADAFAVCAAAADYFARGPVEQGDAAAMARWEQIEPSDREVEALYYKALANPGSEPEMDEALAARMDLRLDEDLETMPVPWRARIKALLGRAVSDAEAATLPDDLREGVESSRFSAAVKQGFATRTARAEEHPVVREHYPGNGPGDSPAHPAAPISADALEREIVVAFDQARFASIPPMAVDYLRALRDRTDAEAELRFRHAESEGYWRHALWKCILIAGSGIAGVEALRPIAQEAVPTLYRPLFGSILAALDNDAASVRAQLAEVFARGQRSPIDFNRAQASRWSLEISETGPDPVELDPSGFCLLALPANSMDALDWPRRPGRPRPRARQQALREVLQKLGQRERPELGDVARAYSEMRSSRRLAFPRVNLDPRLFAVLRGLSPELQPPLASLLVAKPPEIVLTLVRRLTERAPVWPRELYFDKGDELQSPHTTTIVETADQAGVLGDLAKLLAEHDSGAGVIARMHALIGAWFFPYSTDAGARVIDNDEILAFWREMQAARPPRPRRKERVRFVVTLGAPIADATIGDLIEERLGLKVEVGPLFEPDRDLDRFRAIDVPGVTSDDRADLFDVARAINDLLGSESVEPDLGTHYYDADAAPPPEGSAESADWAFWCWVDETASAPADPDWAINKTKVREAWNASTTAGKPSAGKGIVIFQPDTGVVPEHKELPKDVEKDPRSANFVEGGTLTVDPMSASGNPGHGTSTGSVVASAKAGKMTGSAPAATLVPIRCLTSVAVFNQSPVAQAIDHARRNGAHVITMSLGGVWSSALHAAVKKAVAANVIVVAAAGNCVGQVVWPARFDEVVAVGGINEQFKPWPGSSRGPAVDISGPAELVLRADARDPSDRGKVGPGQGTSFATAHLAGVAACWLAHQGRDSLIAGLAPGTTLQQLFRAAVRQSAVVPPGFDTGQFGAGIVDAEHLMRMVPAPVAGPEAVAAAPRDITEQVRELLAGVGAGQTEAAAAAPALADRQNLLEMTCIGLDMARVGRQAPLEALPPLQVSAGLRARLDPATAGAVFRGGVQ